MSEPVTPVVPGNPFPEHVLGAPVGDDSDGVMPLPVYKHPAGTLTRWAFTDEELAWIQQHRCVFINLHTHAVPPVKVIAEPIGVRDDTGDVVVIDTGTAADPLERLAKL